MESILILNGYRSYFSGNIMRGGNIKLFYFALSVMRPKLQDTCLTLKPILSQIVLFACMETLPFSIFDVNMRSYSSI